MRTIGLMLVALSLAATLTPAAAQAKSASPLGDWGSAAPPPGKLYNRNGVDQLDVAVANIGGRGFAPAVRWSARTAAGSPVAGRACRIEVTFPGQRWAMYPSTRCQGSASFPTRVYPSPGRYAITVLDRVSGSFRTVPFVVGD